MMNEIKAIPNIYVHCVDVKDCSLAHLRAIERPEAANQRLILSPELSITFLELGTILDQSLKASGYNYNISLRTVSNWVLGIASLFSSEASSTLPFVKRPQHRFNNTRSKEVLGIEYRRTPKELVIETALTLIETGLVPCKTKLT
jgi:nucleoside-diphosphate-sugar epimerase